MSLVAIDESELVDGYSAAEIFSNTECQGITFDDLIILPDAIDFAVSDVELNAKVTRNYSLNYPLCSSPMDTVTESEMAICMALNGGIGMNFSFFIMCKLSTSDYCRFYSFQLLGGTASKHGRKGKRLREWIHYGTRCSVTERYR